MELLLGTGNQNFVCRTMSLVDLPGMTRVAVRGQRDDIAERLKALITDCIRSPSCIILAVSAANTDLANSDAIMLARSVDPLGDRTIGTSRPALFLSVQIRTVAGVCAQLGNNRSPIK